MNKKLKFLFASLITGTIFFTATNIYAQAESSSNLKMAYSNLENNTGIEHIKISYPDNSYNEHWKDTNNLTERTDTYDENGNLISSIFVLDKGSTVLNLINENGVVNGYSWTLPSEISSENYKILKSSIFDDLKQSIESQIWKSQSLSKDSAKSYTSSNKKIYIDSQKITQEVYDNGTLTRVEEYSKLTDTSSKTFNYNSKLKGSMIKQIDAPVGPIDAKG